MPQIKSAVPPQIIDEASNWFVLMREPSIPAEQNEAFAEWLRASPVHVSVYLEMARLWGDAAHIDPQLSTESDAQWPPNVIPLRDVGEPARSNTELNSSRAGTERMGRRAYGFAATILVAVAVAGSAWLYLQRAPAFAADVGEQRIITLDDGSTVRLNSRSRLKVRMSPQQREIELVHGQALFDVAQDKTRPFVVRSGDVAIRAVGTQFDVNRRQSGTVVTVVEGRVSLNRPDQAQIEPVLVAAGEQVKIATAGDIKRTAKADTAAATSWLQQELTFDGQPLSDVVEELNRYARTPIVLSDPALASLRINAVFHTTNPDSFLRYVERIDGVRIERSASGIRLTTRKPGDSRGK